MAERGLAAILIILFACFLTFASIDIVGLIEGGHFSEIFLLLFCVIASVGWIGFLGALALAGGAASLQIYAGWRPVEE